MKVVHITPTAINTFYLNDNDSAQIRAACQQAGKQWAEQLLGFFINASEAHTYAAVIIRGEDQVVECMEYADIDTSKPEFVIDDVLLTHLAALTPNSVINAHALEGILNNIITAPVRARRWDVYPQISELFPLSH